MAVYERAFLDFGAREGVPDFRSLFGLHAHLFHQSVEEVFSFRVGVGLEPVIGLVEKSRNLIEVQGSAASDNSASVRVLEKAGFRAIGTERSYARGRVAEIGETTLELP